MPTQRRTSIDREKPSASIFAIGRARPWQIVERVQREVKFVLAANGSV